MGMAGAFVAQAEGPSAVFYNIGALALTAKKPKTAAGATSVNLNESLYQGLPPGVGAETVGEQSEISNLRPHAFAAAPLGKTGKLGFGVTAPFAFETEWTDPGNFAGRYLVTAAELSTLDLTTGVSYELAPGVGVGAGVIYRTSDLTLIRRVPSFDPSAGEVVDVASLRLEATLDDGFGWTAGFLYRLSDSISIGGAYRSAIEIEYDGEARFTQISTGNSSLDALIAATTPFDEDLGFQARIEFPASAALGLAFGVGAGTVIEVDANLTEWSSFDTLALRLPDNPEFDEERPQDFADSMAYRLGVKFETASGSFLRFGVSMDETPQPEETMGPLLPDADRISYAVGFSKDWLDVAFLWLDVQGRTTQVNVDDLNGTYNSNAWVLGVTINK